MRPSKQKFIIQPGAFNGLIPHIKKKFETNTQPYRYFVEKPPYKFITSIKDGIKKIIKKNYDSYTINCLPIFYKEISGMILVVFQDCEIQIYQTAKKRKKIDSVNIQAGSFIFLGNSFLKHYEIDIPTHLLICCFNKNIPPLTNIYLKTENRQNLTKVIRTFLLPIKQKPLGEQHYNYLNYERELGKGDFGHVFLSSFEKIKFAVKSSKIKEQDALVPYSYNNSSWYEYHILKDVLYEIVVRNICPNLPLLIDSFYAEDCEITLRDKTEKLPCLTNIVEYASGTLREFFNSNPKEEHILSALFQIMFALASIQKYGQIMNFDIKTLNILYYNVKEGGYWIYKIKNVKYYVPNYGKMFILNDFGISRPMSPYFQLYKNPQDKVFRLGSRFGILVNNKFTPLETKYNFTRLEEMQSPYLIKWSDGSVSNGAEFLLNKANQVIYDVEVILTEQQKSFLEKKKQTIDYKDLNFYNSDYIPPFEFYNDTQDVIRMFIGGKRSTQKGNHSRPECVSEQLFTELSKYDFGAENCSEHDFPVEPRFILASYFISSFFKSYVNYTNNSEENIIEEYKL